MTQLAPANLEKQKSIVALTPKINLITPITIIPCYLIQKSLINRISKGLERNSHEAEGHWLILLGRLDQFEIRTNNNLMMKYPHTCKQTAGTTPKSSINLYFNRT
jgi:hypothetical protein